MATLSPDGQMVVSASEAAEPPAVWNSRDGELLSTLSKTGGGIVSQFAFSPNGRCVASGGQGNTLTVSEPRTGRAFFQSHRFTDGIRALAFAPDGRSILVGSGDGAVQVFRADICGDLPGLLDLAARRVTRALTAEERATYLHETASPVAIPR
jgi:WD40 repeat protein